MGTCPPSSYVNFSWSYFIVLISGLVCFVFLLCFCRVYIHICLQLLGHCPGALDPWTPLKDFCPAEFLLAPSKFMATPLAFKTALFEISSSFYIKQAHQTDYRPLPVRQTLKLEFAKYCSTLCNAVQIQAISAVPRLLGDGRCRVESPVILSYYQRVRDGVPHGQGEADSTEAEGYQSAGAQRLTRIHDCRCNHISLIQPCAR